MKKVRCLYRVSTKKQGDKNDIPMQRISCRDFINQHIDWVFDKEYIELGVSGYNLSESERDVLQDIKRDVLNKEFDILLVFMFDRIGRREEETPFVVEWLIDNNIEVWSVKEGQRKIENRADKLINYLTYWQAGGESEKTSIRVREAQTQMAEKGILTYGSNPPYGYKFVKSGTYTKKGVERNKLIIIEDEAKIVLQIFTLYVIKGYGVARIARELNKLNKKPQKGEYWSTSSISAILRNPIYMGYPAYNKHGSKGRGKRKQSDFAEWVISKYQIDSLVIVSKELWYKAKDIRDNRSKAYKGLTESNIPRQTKSELLLIGLLKCGKCNRSFMSSCSKKKKKDGSTVSYWYYRCVSIKDGHSCSLKTKTMKKDEIEKLVLESLYSFFDSIENIDFSDNLQSETINNQKNEEKELQSCIKNIEKLQKELDTLKEEILKNLMGESRFPSELLNELIEAKEKERNLFLQEKDKLENIMLQKQLKESDIIKFQNMIPIWKKEFEGTDISIKKMLLSQIIKEIRVYDDDIEIDLRLSAEEYAIKNIEDNPNLNYKIIENTVCVKK